MTRLSLRAPLLVLTATAALLAVSACGGSSGSSTSSSASSGSAKNATIAFLMPDIASTRYELYDAPLFKAKMKDLCSGRKVLYQNAQADPSKQQQQANSVLVQGADVLVIDPVDSESAKSIVQAAHDQKVPVISYDRPIPGGSANYYVSFDNEKIGSLIAQSLVDHLKSTSATGGVLEVNGSPTDAAVGLIKKGIESALSSSGSRRCRSTTRRTGTPPRPRSG